MQSFDAISENAAELKLFGKRYEVPVILISSIKRDYYKEELEIASLKVAEILNTIVIVSLPYNMLLFILRILIM